MDGSSIFKELEGNNMGPKPVEPQMPPPGAFAESLLPLHWSTRATPAAFGSVPDTGD